jgi:hypothetical protein
VARARRRGRARQIAVFTGSLLILLIVVGAVRWMQVSTARLLMSIGLFWVVLTVAFELGFGRWMLGYSWNRLQFSPVSPFIRIYAAQYARRLTDKDELIIGGGYANIKYDDA